MEPNDEFLAIAQADVVEWPRLSQQVRLEREQAVKSYHVYDYKDRERAIYYSLEPALAFCMRYRDMQRVEGRKILKQR